MEGKHEIPSSNLAKPKAYAEDTVIFNYYKSLLPEEDFSHFAESYLLELPAVFRIQQQARPSRYQEQFGRLMEKLFDGLPLTRIRSPNFAYQLNLSRRMLRTSDALNEAHKTLVALHEASFITRQELVSMLPPLFLDAQPGEKVLDMCAAPGQKTQQILEKVGLNGFLAANDASLSRAHTLMHNLIDQPTTQLVITNLDATRLPDFPFAFDRVLADVPCSGDGTLRKAPDVWRHWNLQDAFQLHQIQLKCLIRGLSMLKVGGRLVYSTCSMNVVENEAVVAWVLKEFGAAVAIKKIELDGITSRPGFRTWSNIDMMPSTARFAYDEAVSDQLERTHRFYPWLIDSGGFYVAVLEKIAAIDEGLPCMLQMRESVVSYREQNLKKQFCADQSKTMPLHPFARFTKQEVISELAHQFGFSKIFEAGDVADRLDNLLVRITNDGNEPARLYLMNKYVSSIFAFPEANNVFHIVSLGCGAFNRQSGSERGVLYRLESNVNFLLRNTNRVVDVQYETFMKILEAGLEEVQGDTPESVCFDKLPQQDFASALRAQKFIGQVLFRVVDGQFAEFLTDFCISGWLGGNSVGIHMKKKARYALKCLLRQEMIDQLIVSGQTKRKQAHKDRRAARLKDERDAKKDD